MTWAHGSSGYFNHDCRCPICKTGHAAFQRAYRQRRMGRTGERMVHGRFVSSRPDGEPGAAQPGGAHGEQEGGDGEPRGQHEGNLT